MDSKKKAASYPAQSNRKKTQRQQSNKLATATQQDTAA